MKQKIIPFFIQCDAQGSVEIVSIKSVPFFPAKAFQMEGFFVFKPSPIFSISLILLYLI